LITAVCRGVDRCAKLEVFRGDGLCVAEGDHRPSFAPALPSDAFRGVLGGTRNGVGGYLSTPEPGKRAYEQNLGREHTLYSLVRESAADSGWGKHNTRLLKEGIRANSSQRREDDPVARPSIVRLGEGSALTRAENRRVRR
jgi:hypothetical protein